MVSDVLKEEKNEKDKNKIQKKIETPAIFHNEIYNIKLIVQPDNRGNWVIDVNKINISQGTKANDTQSLTDTNIITDVSKDLNPNVTKHENKNIFSDKRGFTIQRQTAPNVIENIIVLLNNKADKSTLLHEFGHVYLQVMNDLARTNSKAREHVLTIDKCLRHEQGSEYTTARHEKFARGFVELVGT